MWKKGNEFPLCALILHGCGHVEGRERVSLCALKLHGYGHVKENEEVLWW